MIKVRTIVSLSLSVPAHLFCIVHDEVEQILDQIEVDEKYDNATREASAQPPSTQDNQQEEEEEDKQKTSQFWQTLENKFKVGDIEYIKELIRKNEIKMDDINPNNGRNLFMISTEYGSYELVSMCINLGANIDIEDHSKQTALKIAKSNGFPGIYLYVKSTMTFAYKFERV